MIQKHKQTQQTQNEKLTQLTDALEYKIKILEENITSQHKINEVVLVTKEVTGDLC